MGDIVKSGTVFWHILRSNRALGLSHLDRLGFNLAIAGYPVIAIVLAGSIGFIDNSLGMINPWLSPTAYLRYVTVYLLAFAGILDADLVRQVDIADIRLFSTPA